MICFDIYVDMQVYSNLLSENCVLVMVLVISNILYDETIKIKEIN